MTEQQVEIQVNVDYLGVEERGRHFQHAFAYRIRITNHSPANIQLLTREWFIIDANANETHVKGEGVIGELPILSSGDHFEYTSWAMIDTKVGTMHGFYGFIDIDSQHHFQVPIPTFRLTQPGAVH